MTLADSVVVANEKTECLEFTGIRFFIYTSFVMKTWNRDTVILKIVQPLALLSMAATVTMYAGESDVRVLRSDGNGVVVEYVPAFRTEIAETTKGVRYIRLHVAGGMGDENQLPGSPEIPVRVATIRLAGLMNNTIEILNVDYEDVQNVLLAPKAGLVKSDIGLTPIATVDPGAYARKNFLPNPIVSLEHVGETRGIVLGSLRFFPYQYNAQDHMVRKYRRIVVHLSFGSPLSMRHHPDNLSTGSALNAYAGSSAIVPQTFSNKNTLGFHNSLFSSGIWYKFEVSEEGMYKLNGQALLNAGIPSSTDPHTIRIFGNGGEELPALVPLSGDADLIENAIFVSDNGIPGKLDTEDFLLFYGKSTRGWTYDPTRKSFSHYLNHFTETNFYWLTYGSVTARMMTTLPSTNSPTALHISSVGGKSFREDEKVNLLASGQEWLGAAMSPNDQMLYMTPLPNLDHSKPISYRIHLGSHSAAIGSFAIREHSQRIDSTVLPRTIIDWFFDDQLKDVILTPSTMPTFSDNQSQLRFTYRTSSAGGNGYIDWCEIFYNRIAVAQNGVCSFYTPDTSALAEFTVTGIPTNPVYVFDVSRFDSVVLITDVRRTLDTCTFQMQLTSGRAAEIIVVEEGSFKLPRPLVRIANQNLHADSAQVDYIIITHRDFLSAAQRLKAFREQAVYPLRTKVVAVDQIYNEFGGGMPMPGAIRNYLWYMYSNSDNPAQYVLLFGDGNYDYRRIIGSGPNSIPPWETRESYDPQHSYASDDYYVTFDPSDRVRMGLGRLTAQSLAEANTMVNKIVEYESNRAQDPWKVRVTLVADDALSGVSLDGSLENDGTDHLDQAEEASGKIPALFEQNKVYLFDYPAGYTSGGRRKPEVNRAIVNSMNQGSVIVSFSGHGNPDLWTHEHVFVRESDFSLLHNKGKYFFLVAATCNFSQFDALDEQSGGEILVSAPDAGAIATFSATRSVLASGNRQLNNDLFAQMFQLDSSGHLRPQRLGDIVYRTKQVRNSENDKKYFLLGDPALRLAFPPLYAQIDSINNFSAQQTVQLRALEKASIVATVRDSAFQPLTNFSGQAQVVVYDADRRVQYVDPDAGNISYKTAGSILFRGQQTVSHGTMNTTFVVPKDVSYGNENGRVMFYFWNAIGDGAGYSTNIHIGSIDTTAPKDVNGPEIELALDNRGFRPGDIVSAAPLLLADLKDSSGINTSNSGIGHQLQMWLDNQSEGIDLSNYYKSKPDTYQEGTVEYALGTLTEGTHHVRLRGWDTYNNATTKETMFNVVTGEGLRLGNVYNFPNPFSAGTTFTFEHDQVSAIDAEIKIYTVAGRLIQTLSLNSIATQFVQIPWDGRDRDGDLLSNGVYLYKVIVSTQDHRFTSEALGKASILR